MFGKKKGRIREKWERDLKSMLLAGPAVCDLDKDGKKEVVVGTKDGRVVMLDEDSNVKWVYNVNEQLSEEESFFYDADSANSVTSQPAIGDIDGDGYNEVVFGTEMGTIYALDNDGKVVWKFKSGGAVRGGVFLEDLDGDGVKEVVFGCTDGNLYVLNSSGSLLWRFNLNSPCECTPFAHPSSQRIIIGCNDGSVSCVKFKEGLAWSYKTGSKVVAQPVLARIASNDTVLAGSTDYKLYALSPDGSFLWSYKTEGAILSPPAVGDIDGDGEEEIVFGSCDNKVYALKKNGDLLWSYETYFWVVAPPVLEDVDGDGNLEVVVGSYDHNLYVLDAKGSYALDYVPGLGGVVHQSGNYSELLTVEPGKLEAKKLWQYSVNGLITGINAYKQDIFVNVKQGKVKELEYER